MKTAYDIRYAARRSLAGKWKTAVLAGLAAALLGGTDNDFLPLKLNVSVNDPGASLSICGHTVLSTRGGISLPFESGVSLPFAGIAGAVIAIGIVLFVAYFILGSIVSVGYAKFNLDLTGGGETTVGGIFDYLDFWQTAAVAKLMKSIGIFLWSLLFVIPGIVAYYSYAVTDYVLAENPHLSASEALEKSKDIMRGNRMRLFCLQLSFIGWEILSAVALGIGALWLTPYKNAAKAEFYRDITQSTSFYEI